MAHCEQIQIVQDQCPWMNDDGCTPSYSPLKHTLVVRVTSVGVFLDRRNLSNSPQNFLMAKVTAIKIPTKCFT